MATIKIPYTYRSYAFSQEATKYSKRLSRGRGGTGIVAGIFIWMLTTILVYSILEWLDLDYLVLFALVISLVIAIGSGICLEKLRTRYLKRKIAQALERDIVPYERTQPELAQAIRKHIETDLLSS